jgi:hypothetical protein
MFYRAAPDRSKSMQYIAFTVRSLTCVRDDKALRGVFIVIPKGVRSTKRGISLYCIEFGIEISHIRSR